MRGAAGAFLCSTGIRFKKVVFENIQPVHLGFCLRLFTAKCFCLRLSTAEQRSPTKKNTDSLHTYYFENVDHGHDHGHARASATAQISNPDFDPRTDPERGRRDIHSACIIMVHMIVDSKK